MKKKKLTKSIQILADFIDCNFDLIKFNYFFQKSKNILIKNNVKFIKYNFFIFDKNNGATLIFILSNSHLSIHTWPEKKLLNFDLFICNFKKNYEKKILDTYKDFKVLLQPKKTIFKKIIRTT
ncbi:MAG: hypothetical protein KatS3mg095_0828 [Candidatus Parcubacteria bacterium]|nr:MAG: hypothetical protein KatS3mg095_0828 [Candidatus Parcubacteria bacterium]